MLRVKLEGILNAHRSRLTEWLGHIPLSLGLIVGLGFIAIQTLTLLAMGHPPICKCGVVKLWNGMVSSLENSQQITDWYTYTHIIHGFGFYGLFR